MKVDKELIKKLAFLARLNLTESEIKEFLPQLKEILSYFSELEKISTKDVKPSFQPIEIKNVMREDKIESCLTQNEALSNVDKDHKKDGFFKGPKVI